MITEPTLIARLVNPPYFNVTQTQIARLPTNGTFTGLIGQNFNRNVSLNTIFINSNGMTVPCYGTELTQLSPSPLTLFFFFLIAL